MEYLQSEQMLNLIINVALIILLIVILGASLSRNRYRIYAILIPFLTSFGIVIYYLQSKSIVLQKEEEAVEVLAAIATEQINCTEPLNNEIINAVEELMNNDLKIALDMMISLFAIAISVWVGLTIYNAVKKDEVDKLTDAVKQAKTVSEQSMELYKSYLLKNLDVNNNSSQYFYNVFKNIDAQQFEFNFLMNATFLETLYVKITQLHNMKEHSKMLLFLEEAMNLCEQIIINLKNKKTLSYHTKNKLYGYAYYRCARIYFYHAFMLYYTIDDYDERVILFFEKAIQNFKKSIRLDSHIAVEINIYNTIGYIYIKSYDYIRKYKECASWDSDETLKLLLEEAHDSCLKAYKGSYKTSLSVKNLGITFERKNEMDKAIEKYIEATQIDSGEYTSHICLASAYIKMAKKTLGIKDIRNKLLYEYSYNVTNEALEYIYKAYAELLICYSINPSRADYYYKMGQLDTYRILITTRERDRATLIQRVITNFEIVSKLNPIPKAYLFHLRNFYEAVKEIKKANEINSSLKFSDSQHYAELYSKYLDKE